MILPKLKKPFPLKETIFLLIITIPTFISLFHAGYFTHHDDQHITRLFLLDQGIKQGYIYPRWVDWLGFNFGYPLFNFYPPLIYYVAEVFHLIGFDLVWSIKLMLMTGFFVGALGMYLLARRFFGRWLSFVPVVIFNFFFYRAILVYVRGAWAEFWAMSLLPWVVYSLIQLKEEQSSAKICFLVVSFGLLLVAHPLIAFPFLIFFSLMFFYHWLNTAKKLHYLISVGIGSFLGLGLSAFFWLPSLFERKSTMVDSLLTKDLYNYQLHFVCPSQFWYSPWGFGGSTAGCVDGISFQLGKIPILLLFISMAVFVLAWSIRILDKAKIWNYIFYLFLFLLSLFLMTDYSLIIWQNITFLWYLQFPWRMMTFSGLYIGLLSGFSLDIGQSILVYFRVAKKVVTKVILLLMVVVSGLTLVKYQQYFRPQQYLNVSEQQITSFEEISWRVSETSYEFSPKGVKTVRKPDGSKAFAVTKKTLNHQLYRLVDGQATVKKTRNLFQEKSFNVESEKGVNFELQTFNFPGWTAYLDGRKIQIKDNNDFKLISVELPPGAHQLIFKFENTLVRNLAQLISLISLFIILVFIGYNIKRKYA